MKRGLFLVLLALGAIRLIVYYVHQHNEQQDARHFRALEQCKFKDDCAARVEACEARFPNDSLTTTRCSLDAVVAAQRGSGDPVPAINSPSIDAIAADAAKCEAQYPHEALRALQCKLHAPTPAAAPQPSSSN